MGLLRSLAKKVLGKEAPKASGGASSGAGPGQPGPSTAGAGGLGASTAAPGASGQGPKPADATDKPWYLDGTNDGWDTTDVKKE